MPLTRFAKLHFCLNQLLLNLLAIPLCVFFMVLREKADHSNFLEDFDQAK